MTVVQFTSKASRSALFGGILKIIKGCAREKMERIATRWIVAFVAGEIIARIIAGIKEVGDAMGFQIASFGLELSIATAEFGMLPFPAFILFSDGDFAPKTSNI